MVCGSGGRRALEQVAKNTAARYNGYFTNYFANDDNPEYHRRVTGPQILKAAGDAIDAVVIGVGSGGTITGVAEYLKAWNSMIRIVAVEPGECAAISGCAGSGRLLLVRVVIQHFLKTIVVQFVFEVIG